MIFLAGKRSSRRRRLAESTRTYVKSCYTRVCKARARTLFVGWCCRDGGGGGGSVDRVWSRVGTRPPPRVCVYTAGRCWRARACGPRCRLLVWPGPGATVGGPPSSLQSALRVEQPPPPHGVLYTRIHIYMYNTYTYVYTCALVSRTTPLPPPPDRCTPRRNAYCAAADTDAVEHLSRFLFIYIYFINYSVILRNARAHRVVWCDSIACREPTVDARAHWPYVFCSVFERNRSKNDGLCHIVVVIVRCRDNWYTTASQRFVRLKFDAIIKTQSRAVCPMLFDGKSRLASSAWRRAGMHLVVHRDHAVHPCHRFVSPYALPATITVRTVVVVVNTIKIRRNYTRWYTLCL